MNYCWKYEKGNWSPTKDPAGEVGDEGFGEALQRNGYNTNPYLDLREHDWGASIGVYKKDNDTSPLYIIVTLPNDDCMTVLVDDMDDLMQWLKEYLPVIHFANTSVVQSQMLELLEKAFRAWHEHDSADICPRCDPMGYQAREERRLQKRRELTKKGDPGHA